MIQKAALRSLVLQRRDVLDPAVRREASRRIVEAVMARDAFRRARSVMAYATFGSEVDTSVLCETVLAAGKRLLLPRVDTALDAIRVYEVRDLAGDLEANRWGIREPRARCPEVAPAELEFVFVPGVAFDACGGRLTDAGRRRVRGADRRPGAHGAPRRAHPGDRHRARRGSRIMPSWPHIAKPVVGTIA